MLTPSAFDTPLSYEAMRAAGSGLGAAGFIVFDDTADLVAVAAGVARFLAVESCGQCRHCKDDGLALAALLARLAASRPDRDEADELGTRLDLVAEGARCNLATQQQVVVGSILEQFPELVAAHTTGDAPPVEPAPIAELRDVSDGRASLDDGHRTKQPDWTHDAVDSGQWPADRLDEHRSAHGD